MSGENAEVIGRFVAGAADRALTEGVREAALRCLVDWMGVKIGRAHV